jgi:hypothetical protein
MSAHHAEADKKQVNFYIPPHIDKYIESIKNQTGIHKSDFAYLMFAYSLMNFTPEKIKALAGRMTALGEEGLLENVA